MLDFHAFSKNRLESMFLDSKSKPPIQNAAENLEIFGNFSIYLGCSMVLNSCWIHAGFMLNSCIFRRVTLDFHSCQIHVRFMLNSCISMILGFGDVLVYYCIQLIIMAHCQTCWANRVCLVSSKKLIDLCSWEKLGQFYMPFIKLKSTSYDFIFRRIYYVVS